MEITEESFPEVRSRQEMYLQDIIKSLSNESISDNNYPDPLSRQEAYLQIIISKLRANDPNIEIKTEDIEKAVNKYFEQNPIQLGATENQAKQIEENKKDVASLKAETGSLKEDLSNKITKFYASNEGKNHLADSDNGKIEDMVLYGKSEQKQYKGINLLPPDTNFKEYVEVSIPKGSLVFWVTDGILTNGGNFRFFNEDKTESMWFGIDSNTTSKRMSLTIDAKYVQNLISTDFDLSKICLGVGSKPIYEPYTGGIPSPSPDYPQKIKNVVNPTVKVCGKNLWNPTLGGYISGSDGSIKAAPKKKYGRNRFYKNKWKRYYCYSTQL